MPPDIPSDQLKSIQPIISALLADLRRQTARMPVQTPSAVDYQLESEPPEAAQDFGVRE